MCFALPQTPKSYPTTESGVPVFLDEEKGISLLKNVYNEKRLVLG